jgi:uncharacterized protein YegL
MPDLMGKSDSEVYKTVSGFHFSGVGLDQLASSEYTIINILVDETGSVGGFEQALEKCIKQIVDACKKSPHSENLLLRVGKFSSSIQNMIEEIHGFKLLSIVDQNEYDGKIKPSGSTPLLDATLDSIETLEAQAKILADQEYLCNGVFYVITDGEENSSRKASYKKIEEAFKRIKKSEKPLESIQAFLLGVNDTNSQTALDKFKTDAMFDDYISIGDATPGKLAKLAKWVSQSISSTSQALGSGGPSQPVPQPSFTL